MRTKILHAAALAVMAGAGLALPLSAEAADYTMSPAGPVDSRNSFVSPVSSVFVVDNAKDNQHVLPRQQGRQDPGRLHACDQAAAIEADPARASRRGEEAA
jgi:hypothetical protein